MGEAALPDYVTGDPPETLSAYSLFAGNGSTQQPAAGVIPYDLNTPLFSDYASKYRFVWMPPGTSTTCSPRSRRRPSSQA